ncbi:uncharacterized protein LAESUDRAFT_711646 [Laetiporus sulphureus 93-53]|uniref:DUF659 domain-containing protein n=1 Tax=Laetiporus sulphureus 93-53 TaxID=1314785 RepID=A0A165GKP4_9APHY|nr:uncharacterized protein LAESUDRAFT_711646 [Laetiporus sulphureus 93-53]KZT10484.1 hypothetical protein LAESUDRAFT_711646 [Laetiporus sulphureus 93-53]
MNDSSEGSENAYANTKKETMMEVFMGAYSTLARESRQLLAKVQLTAVLCWMSPDNWLHQVMCIPSSINRVTMVQMWWADYLYDHPGHVQRALDAYTTVQREKLKVWCKRCFDRWVTDELQAEQDAVTDSRATYLLFMEFGAYRKQFLLQPDGLNVMARTVCDIWSPTIFDYSGILKRQCTFRSAHSQQQHFEFCVTRLIASCGWSLTWVENPEFPAFCEEFIPVAKVPSRKQHARGHLGTIQCNGWTAMSVHHLLSFMHTVRKEVHTVHTYDTSGEEKTAACLLVRIKQVMEVVEAEWGVTVIAITSDCSGEARAARKQIMQQRPDLVAPNCYGHQCLLDAKNSLAILVDDERIFHSGTAASHAKTCEMILIIKDPFFWHGLTRIKNHLEPLAIATNVTQEVHCHLDQVLLIFRFLFIHFNVLSDPNDAVIHENIIASIESCWSKADQEVFIAAVILNPFYKIAPFACINIFTNAGITMLIRWLWLHFFKSEVPLIQLGSELLEYLGSTGSYESMTVYQSQIESDAVTKGKLQILSRIEDAFAR